MQGSKTSASALDSVTKWTQDKRSAKEDALSFYFIFCLSHVTDDDFRDMFCRCPGFDVTELGIRKEFVKMQDSFVGGGKDAIDHMHPLKQFFMHYKLYARDLSPSEAADALSRHLVKRACELKGGTFLLRRPIRWRITSKHRAPFA